MTAMQLPNLRAYGELARLHRPTGWIPGAYCCITGTMTVAVLNSSVQAQTILRTNSVLLVGCIMFRSLGCTWNDIVDQDIDRRTRRTRSRPIARGTITTKGALAFAIFQLILGMVVVSQTLPGSCFLLGIPSILLTVAYPFAKRFTVYPQIVLGFPISWGVVQAYPALGLDLRANPTDTSFLSLCVLLMASIAWTVIYDSIYAAQDLQDDLQTGVGSPIIKHGRNSKAFLATLACLQVSLLAGLGILLRAEPIFYLLSCGLTGLGLAFLLLSIDLEQPKDCAWGFNFAVWAVGFMMVSGFVANYLQLQLQA